jgi:hypothetical protein
MCNQPTNITKKRMRSYLCGHALVLIQCHTPTNIARHTHSIRSASLPLTDTHTHTHTHNSIRLASTHRHTHSLTHKDKNTLILCPSVVHAAPSPCGPCYHVQFGRGYGGTHVRTHRRGRAVKQPSAHVSAAVIRLKKPD